MNQKIPWLTRQMVYGFLLGIIIGGVSMAFFDAYARKPLFSNAFMSAEFGGLPPACDSFSGDTINCWRNSFWQSGNNWYDSYGGVSSPEPIVPAPNTQTTGTNNPGPGTPGTSVNPPPTPGNTVGEGNTCEFRHGIWICYNQ